MAKDPRYEEKKRNALEVLAKFNSALEKKDFKVILGNLLARWEGTDYDALFLVSR